MRKLILGCMLFLACKSYAGDVKCDSLFMFKQNGELEDLKKTLTEVTPNGDIHEFSDSAKTIRVSFSVLNQFKDNLMVSVYNSSGGALADFASHSHLSTFILYGLTAERLTLTAIRCEFKP